MNRITALRPVKGPGKRVQVYLDGKRALNLEADLVADERLKVEQELTPEKIQELTESNRYYRCLSIGMHYLSYRPRSESELKIKLRQRAFDSEIIDRVISRLKTLGLVDDEAFAQFWKENRESFNPRSRRLTGLELRQKGVADSIINEVVGPIDDDESAYRAIAGKARNLSNSDYESFRRRVGGYLKRRGFSYGTINHTVERIWREQVNSK